jgi:predicted phosphodiesterase
MLLGIISDIHEDLPQLSAALRQLERKGVDEIVCLGDIVGFAVPFYGYLKSRDANSAVALIRQNCSLVVIGNHDLYHAKRIPTHRSFFDYPSHWYDLDFEERKRLSRDQVFLYEENELSALLSRENRGYLASLPEYVVKDLGDHRILFSHYAFPDCTGSSTHVVRDSRALDEHFQVMDRLGCVYSFSGNDHIEGVRVFTENRHTGCAFDMFRLPSEPLWVNGPAICSGTTDNGLMIYDSSERVVHAQRLGARKHVVPQHA